MLNRKPSGPKPSREALVQFFNNTLQLELSGVEQLGDGAAYCQLMDAIYGDVPMARVTFDCMHEPDKKEQNFKILQRTFVMHNIQYNFDMRELMKCRIHDNLSFAQWCYQFWEAAEDKIPNYEPAARRGVRRVASGRLRAMRSMDMNNLPRGIPSKQSTPAGVRAVASMSSLKKRGPAMVHRQPSIAEIYRPPAIAETPRQERMPAARAMPRFAPPRVGPPRLANSSHLSNSSFASQASHHDDASVLRYNDSEISAQHDASFGQSEQAQDLAMEWRLKAEQFERENGELQQKIDGLDTDVAQLRKELADAQSEIIRISQESMQLSQSVDVLEGERDSYYSKLQRVTQCISESAAQPFESEEIKDFAMPFLERLCAVIESDARLPTSPVHFEQPF